MIHGRRFLAGGAAAFLILTASCNKGEPKGQVIAVVNGEEITVGELNEEAKARGLSIGNDPAIRATAVQELVSRKLLVQEAKRLELDRTPEHLLAARRINELLLVRQLVGDAATAQPSDAEVARFINSHPFAFDRRMTFRVTQVAAPASFRAGLGAAQSIDDVQALLQKARVGAKRSEETWDSAQLPQDLTIRLLGSKGALVLIPEAERMVAVQVISVTPQPVPPDQRVSTARQWMVQQRSETALRTLVDQAKSKAKIQYQAGFAPGE